MRCPAGKVLTGLAFTHNTGPPSAKAGVVPRCGSPNGFTVDSSVGSIKQLACFSSNEGELRLERLGRRIEARFNSMLPKGRSRVNCTLPGPNKRWHFGSYVWHLTFCAVLESISVGQICPKVAILFFFSFFFSSF